MMNDIEKRLEFLKGMTFSQMDYKNNIIHFKFKDTLNNIWILKIYEAWRIILGEKVLMGVDDYITTNSIWRDSPPDDYFGIVLKDFNKEYAGKLINQNIYFDFTRSLRIETNKGVIFESVMSSSSRYDSWILYNEKQGNKKCFALFGNGFYVGKIDEEL